MSTTLSKIWLSVGPFFHNFVYNSLVSRPFFTHKVSNRSSQRAPRIGQGVVSSIQLSVRSTIRSNLGQTWSNLVKLGQSSPNSGKCIPNHVLRVFWHSGPQTGKKQLGQTSVNPRSTSVKLGQTWSKLSGLWEMYPGPRFEGF